MPFYGIEQKRVGILDKLLAKCSEKSMRLRINTQLNQLRRFFESFEAKSKYEYLETGNYSVYPSHRNRI